MISVQKSELLIKVKSWYRNCCLIETFLKFFKRVTNTSEESLRNEGLVGLSIGCLVQKQAHSWICYYSQLLETKLYNGWISFSKTLFLYSPPFSWDPVPGRGCSNANSLALKLLEFVTCAPGCTNTYCLIRSAASCH